MSDLGAQVFIAHAAPGGKTEAFARKLAGSGKPLLTLDSPANGNLREMGAEVIEAEWTTRRWYTKERQKRDNSLYLG